MAEEGTGDEDMKELSNIIPSGVLPIEGANAAFLEPCLMLNSSSYSRFSVDPNLYYSRSFFFSRAAQPTPSNDPTQSTSKTKKRKRKKAYSPNPKEQQAEKRHQEIRQFILSAHTTFLAQRQLPFLLQSLERCLLSHANKVSEGSAEVDSKNEEDVNFVKLADLWQAPFYEITLSASQEMMAHCKMQEDWDISTSPLFDHMVENFFNEEILAKCVGKTFLLPNKCRLLISDFAQIHQLVPGYQHNGYNLLLVDPPWENKSVHRQALYPTLPNRYLLSLPIQKLAHTEGALLGLWITNREKLRAFVEEQLFPSWGVVISGTWYWLKVTSNGEMVSDLDLVHHKPYECLLLGYVLPQRNCGSPCKDLSKGASAVQIPVPKAVPDKHVLISIPGDHSRKPPVGLLLSPYAPGPTPVKGLELFARELNAGWTSWGNEPLHFQQLKYFIQKS